MKLAETLADWKVVQKVDDWVAPKVASLDETKVAQ